MTTEIHNIMALCADIVEKAKSGHPGAPLGLSQFIHILYTEYLVLDPDNPRWPGRDIFILSNGHACAIQYLMNHLLGFLDRHDLLNFRQLNSKTPGHPERSDNGIEVSTGPLGQGVAASVGFAISSRLVGLSNHVYCVFGDGCYQEGVSQEAFSLCATLGLCNITFIYDFNKVTIDGPTTLSMREDVPGRFKSLGFDVLETQDTAEEIRQALDKKGDRTKVIILHTRIGKGSTVEGTCKAHGSPLGEENVKKLKKKLGMPETAFYFSSELEASYERAKERMRQHRDERAVPEMPGTISAVYGDTWRGESQATRVHFAQALNAIETSARILSGCADLTPSIKLQQGNAQDLTASYSGPDSYIRYGIREHAMCGVMNGIAAHGFYVPVGGTFLNFAAYGVPAIKIACLDRLKVLYAFSHDSIGLGEDGPTHQPVEVLATLRALPHLTVFRPCDGAETRQALQQALQRPGPSALVLTRQAVAEQDRTGVTGVERGAYFLSREEGHEAILIATGSEVELAMQAKRILKTVKISVVSMYSMEIFEEQTGEYRKEILDEKAVKISIEALSTFGWGKYSDYQIGLDEFGRSGPGEEVFDYFGFTGEKIARRVHEFMRNN